MALIGNWIESYKNKDGKNIFVYVVIGEQDELADFVNKQGQYHRTTPDGRAKFYTPFYGGKRGSIILNYAKDKYVFDTSKLDQISSLTEQFGGNANLVFAEKFKDFNWLLNLENEESNPNKKANLSNDQKQLKEKLSKDLKVVVNAQVTPVIKAQKDNYIEESINNNGFSFLNEWHFAAKVVNHILKGEEISFKILSSSDPLKRLYYSGILQDSVGNKYNIEESENIWMFNELLFIFNLMIEEDTDKMVLTIKKNTP